jgi:hypothetical protein
MTGEWKKLNVLLKNWLFINLIIINMRFYVKYEYYWHKKGVRCEIRNLCKILIGMLRGKSWTGIPWGIWDGNTDTDCNYLGWESVDAFEWSQRKAHWRIVLNMEVILRFPKKKRGVKFLDSLILSRRTLHPRGHFVTASYLSITSLHRIQINWMWHLTYNLRYLEELLCKSCRWLCLHISLFCLRTILAS